MILSCLTPDSLFVQYDLGFALMYNIYLGATTTTILSTRGVKIPIDLVSSATDSLVEVQYYLSLYPY